MFITFLAFATTVDNCIIEDIFCKFEKSIKLNFAVLMLLVLKSRSRPVCLAVNLGRFHVDMMRHRPICTLTKNRLHKSRNEQFLDHGKKNHVYSWQSSFNFLSSHRVRSFSPSKSRQLIWIDFFEPQLRSYFSQSTEKNRDVFFRWLEERR